MDVSDSVQRGSKSRLCPHTGSYGSLLNEGPAGYFTLSDVTGVDVFRLRFVPGDLNRGMGAMTMKGATIYYLSIDSSDVSNFRMSVIRSPDEPQAKNIRFIPKR
jgi:hypothetical protein